MQCRPSSGGKGVSAVLVVKDRAIFVPGGSRLVCLALGLADADSRRLLAAVGVQALMGSRCGGEPRCSHVLGNSRGRVG